MSGKARKLRKCNFLKKVKEGFFNPFIPNVPFLYPLKTSENLTAF